MSANENKGRQNGVFYQMKVLSVHIKDSQRIESWVCKESDTTECAHTHTCTCCIGEEDCWT